MKYLLLVFLLSSCKPGLKDKDTEEGIRTTQEQRGRMAMVNLE